MTIRSWHAAAAFAALLACGLLALPATADDTQPAPSSQRATRGDAGDRTRSETPPPDRTERHDSAKEPREQLGEKTWKERINTVARKKVEHDLEYVDSRDRDEWDGHQVWHGVRDRRPIIARKTVGFDDRDPGLTRRERVQQLGRGPLRGPAPAE
jgi:hypothetical protein